MKQGPQLAPQKRHCSVTQRAAVPEPGTRQDRRARLPGPGHAGLGSGASGRGKTIKKQNQKSSRGVWKAACKVRLGSWRGTAYISLVALIGFTPLVTPEVMADTGIELRVASTQGAASRGCQESSLQRPLPFRKEAGPSRPRARTREAIGTALRSRSRLDPAASPPSRSALPTKGGVQPRPHLTTHHEPPPTCHHPATSPLTPVHPCAHTSSTQE